jgi:DivIVA domain-containing protein
VPDRPESQRPDEEPIGERLHEGGEVDVSTQLLTLARPSELVPAEIRDVSFGAALGGYNRAQVDAYVERVNRAIAELEVSRSPENAVKLALDRVGEQTAGILQQAREAAAELTATALAEAEHAARRARVEAAELIEHADTESRRLLERSEAESEELTARSRARLQELREEIEEARLEHRRVLEELRATAAELDAFAVQAEDGRPAPHEPAPGASDGRDDLGEQPTEVTPALESSPDGAGEDDRDDAASPGPARRRATGARANRR